MPSLECTVGLLNRCYVASTSRLDSTRHDKDSASSTRFSVMVFFSGVYTWTFSRDRTAAARDWTSSGLSPILGPCATEGAAGFLLARFHD